MTRLSILAAAMLLCASGAGAQTIQDLKHPAPAGAIFGVVLTDGTAFVQGEGFTDWWKLTPDETGAYVNGTWTRQARLPPHYAPLYFASAVLADGRLVIAGGEYDRGHQIFTDTCAIYDPVINSWTKIAPPPKWDFIGDSPASVLPDGKFLLGRKFDKRIAALNPATLQWTELNATGKRDFNAEEGWTLLPNGTVLTADVKAAPNTETYDPARQKWTSTGPTPVNLMGPPSVHKIMYGHDKIYHPPGEIGPAILRPDGTVFATGALHRGATAGHTAIYTPDGHGHGSWQAGPDFQSGDAAGDSFAILLPTGNVLVEADLGNLYEFNGTTLRATGFKLGGPLSGGMLLLLPSGEVLLGGTAVYRAAGQVNQAWAPTIESVPTQIKPGRTYKITGTQFNGLSQANAFGDELQSATNYPLVRITNTASSHVTYARTHGHSTMAVATGTTPVSTNFDVPSTIETGPSTLVVVANGIASAAADVTIQ